MSIYRVLRRALQQAQMLTCHPPEVPGLQLGHCGVSVSRPSWNLPRLDLEVALVCRKGT